MLLVAAQADILLANRILRRLKLRRLSRTDQLTARSLRNDVCIENVMFDIIYLFIYILFEKIWFEKTNRTMRMFLYNPNVNRLSINSKLEIFFHEEHV